MPSDEMSLSRRAYVGLAGAGTFGLAGCSGRGSPDAGSGATTGAPATDTGDDPTATPQTETEAEPTTARSGETDIERMEAELADFTFDGSFFDTHAHWQGNELGDRIAAEYGEFMRAHDVGAAALFSPTSLAASDYGTFLAELTEPGVDYLPFMGAPPPDRRRLSAGGFESLYEGNESTFYGVGEWKPQNDPPPSLVEPPWSDIFEFAGRHDLVVMYHPFPGQQASVREAIERYPETTFLLHGHQMLAMGERTRLGIGDFLPSLLGEHKNLYWTHDFASMTGGQFLRPDLTADAFLDVLESNRGRFVEQHGAVLQRLLETAPGQVTWGTDVALNWHMDEDVMDAVMGFTRELLDALPAEHRDAYAYENALELFRA